MLVSGEQALATFRATLSGFADPDQPELMNPYREKYFAVVGDVWRNWSSAMAQDFVSGAYTVSAISEETVRMTDEYIAATDPPAALRRLLLEGRDDVLRALRCQAKDRQARDRQAVGSSDQDAGDVGVLVDPVAGADPVVAVGDDERVLLVAAQQQDR